MLKEPGMEETPEADASSQERGRAAVADPEFSHALKTLSDLFGAMQKSNTEVRDAVKELTGVVKATYTSKPKPVDADYPTPPTDGPKSDGVQAPKIDQEINPHSKPFGKDAAKLTKVALGGAPEAGKEGVGMEGAHNEYLKVILQKGTTAEHLTRYRYGDGRFQ